MPMRKKLCEILDDYGHDLCTEPKRLKALLKDLCVGHKKEINILIHAAEQHVVSRMRTASKAVPTSITLATCKSHLESVLGMNPKMAKWAVDAWAMAIGFEPKRTIPTKPKYILIPPPELPEQKTTPQPAQKPIPPPAPFTKDTVNTPVIDPAGGQYDRTVHVSITCKTTNAVIRYTINGTEPTEHSPVYEREIPIENPTLLKAKAFLSGMAPSETTEAEFKFCYIRIGRIKRKVTADPVSAIFTEPTQNERDSIGQEISPKSTEIANIFQTEHTTDTKEDWVPPPIKANNSTKRPLTQEVLKDSIFFDQTPTGAHDNSSMRNGEKPASENTEGTNKDAGAAPHPKGHRTKTHLGDAFS